ncbi:zinc finger protein 704 isoform X2 [Leptopilina heterotoma]|uniref:zinc finger protein 704 isoform X2 n=1 Tax=Leptopilina heterotoma TaxID=63436 RepID=UPI001CA8F359|nr:zinc finger protein 704 isoform X2 [Leptopilina heterotoma]
MSTGKRLAKRSIVGTKVCAPGEDGMYYSGFVYAVKSPSSSAYEAGLSLTSKTRFIVKFDPILGQENRPMKEYSEREIIGPGFSTITKTKLVRGQKVFLTYNGREIQAEVTEHNFDTDEVHILIAPTGHEVSMSITKKLDEVRLLESRKSARLAYSDTDFARLADMAGDRKRSSSNSIDVPNANGPEETMTRTRKQKRCTCCIEREEPLKNNVPKNGTKRNRKRRTSSGNESNDCVPHHNCKDAGNCRIDANGICMNDTDAAKLLISFSLGSASPCAHGQKQLPIGDQNYGSWRGREDGVVVSPGVGGTSNSSSSSGASWRSGTPSPPLSDEGTSANNATTWSNQVHASHSPKPGSTPDDGLLTDFFMLNDLHPRKKKRTQEHNDQIHPAMAWHLQVRSKSNLVEQNPNSEINVSDEETRSVFKCSWPRCFAVRSTIEMIEKHVRESHLGPRKKDETDHEEEFYYQEIEMDLVSSPPTMSHRDMARPPHEDPEYLKQFHVEAIPASIYAENALRGDRPNPFSISSSSSTKHLKLSSRSFHNLQHNVGLLTLTTDKLTASPRRNRGETKKCRKVYGMDQRLLWCTQCRWKKACTRFND